MASKNWTFLLHYNKPNITLKIKYLKAIKNVLSKRQDYTKGSSKASGEKKVMSFDDFEKSEINRVKK